MADFEPRPLHLHTLESLVADLVSGRPILVGENQYSLPHERARSALQWYRQRGKANWTSNVNAPLGEDLVNGALQTPPEVPPLPARAANAHGRRLTLKKVEAHRFAGVHKFGTPEAAPADFTYKFTAPLTLFEGRNGSGKTSLVNSILWALTGEILRPQRAPEATDEEFECQVSPANAGDEPTTHKLSPVTPMPNVSSYRPDHPNIPLDTWVELTFEDDTGAQLHVRRTHRRTARGALVETTQTRDAAGALVETAPDLSVLGVDPIALRIGTLMPGLLPVIKVGTGSELGLAVAQLTGLASLVDLASHAGRVKRRIDTEFVREKTTAKGNADISYGTAKADLEAVVQNNVAIKGPLDVPVPSDDPKIEETLEAITRHFEALKASAFKSAQDILGEEFDPNDAASSADLEKNIDLALDQAAKSQNLASLARLRALAALSKDDLATVEKTIAEIVAEGKVLEELAQKPGEAARIRLYARVATWIADHPEPDRDEYQCVVCGGSLHDAVDPLTGKPVSTHLHDAKADADLVSQTIERWSSNASGAFLRAVPEAVRTELAQNLPDHPTDLMRAAVVEELFEETPYSGVLGSLSESLARSFDEAVAGRENLHAPLELSLPQGCDDLAAALKRADLAVRFSKWRNANGELAKHLSDTVLGRPPKGEEQPDPHTLIGKLLALKSTVTEARPVSDCLVQCGRLQAHLKTRRAAEKRLAEYAEVSEALTHLMNLGGLAKQQVDQLQQSLRNEASVWRSRIYLGAFPGTAHELSNTSSGPKGELEIRVKADGVAAPAQHVTNASALRASLVAFYLAFWEHVLTERGGLTTIILDDPQELLDDENRERFAASFSHLVACGARPILTSYDPRFAGRVSRLTGIGGVDHKAVHPATIQQPVLRVVPPLNKVLERKELFEKDPNAEQPAREYANECRMFLEAILGDLFDEPAHLAWVQANPDPTFHTFGTRLRTQVAGAPHGMYSAHVFRRFINHPGTADGSPVRELMNKAHHGRYHEITAGEVAACSGSLGELIEMAEQMYEECYRWRRRDAVNAQGQPLLALAPLESIELPKLNITVCPDLAAFTHHAPVGETQEPAELLNPDILSSKAVYFVRRDNFGFAAPEGALAIVESVPGPVADRRLVIARHGDTVYARRFLKPASGTLIGLTAESPDPRKKNSRSVLLPENEVELHQVVGVIFDHDLKVQPGKEEALQVDATKVFEQIELAYRVSDTSAVPLALDKQVVLGGRYIQAAELSQFEGSLVALTLDDGASLFKRVASTLPGELSHLRKFESVGGLGSSEVLAVGKDQEGCRRVDHARLIVGVLYHG